MELEKLLHCEPDPELLGWIRDEVGERKLLRRYTFVIDGGERVLLQLLVFASTLEDARIVFLCNECGNTEVHMIKLSLCEFPEVLRNIFNNVELHCLETGASGWQMYVDVYGQLEVSPEETEESPERYIN